MSPEPEEIASLHEALAEAERQRDEALALNAAWQAGQRDRRIAEQHHLRNTISVIRAIVHRTRDDAETTDDYCGLLDARLTSYLGVQAMLASNPGGGLDLEVLILDELLKFGIANDKRVRVAGPAVTLTGRTAGLVALTIHDLVSDIIIGGFEWSEGALYVVWQIDRNDPDWPLTISWTSAGETAGGADTPSSWSQSLQMAIRHQLGGTLAWTATPAVRSVSLVLPATCFLGEADPGSS